MVVVMVLSVNREATCFDGGDQHDVNAKGRTANGDLLMNVSGISAYEYPDTN